jgi:hypothetical protein
MAVFPLSSLEPKNLKNHVNPPVRVQQCDWKTFFFFWLSLEWVCKALPWTLYYHRPSNHCVAVLKLLRRNCGYADGPSWHPKHHRVAYLGLWGGSSFIPSAGPQASPTPDQRSTKRVGGHVGFPTLFFFSYRTVAFNIF